MRFRSIAAISPGQMAKVTGPWRLMQCATARSRRRVWSLSQLGEPPSETRGVLSLVSPG
jgi:hypothetical protein